MKIIGIIEEESQGENLALLTDPPLTEEVMDELQQVRRLDRPEERLSQKNGHLIVPQHRLRVWALEGYTGDKLTAYLTEQLCMAESTAANTALVDQKIKEERKQGLQGAFGLPVKSREELLAVVTLANGNN